MRSPSILRALAGHHGICLHLSPYVRSQHAISDAFTRDILTLTARTWPTALAPSAAHARSCASAVYHAHAGAVCNSRPSMSMHYQSHTRDLKKKAYMRPDWRGMHGMHGSKKCKMHSDRPPDRAVPCAMGPDPSMSGTKQQASL
jgi:hypothetical protein